MNLYVELPFFVKPSDEPSAADIDPAKCGDFDSFGEAQGFEG